MKSIYYNNNQIQPSKIVCVGRNYVEHIRELNNELPDSMVLFCKPNSAISETLYFFDDACRFEGEISFLVEKGEIAAVGVGLDMTKGDLQNKMKAKGLPWERAKAFDGSAVFSEFITLREPVETLRMTLELNGTAVQVAETNLMVHKPDAILAEIRSFMTLEDGDIIMTGTPKGVGSYRVGDCFVGRLYSGDSKLLERKWIVEERK